MSKSDQMPKVEKGTLSIKTPRVFVPLLKPSRYKGVYGGRSSGKSHWFSEAVVERCVLQRGSRIVCVREVQKSLKESVKLLIEDKIKAFGLTGQFHIMADSIKTPGNGIISFQGMADHTAESIKSLEGFDVAYVEEAQTLTAKSLELLRPTIRKDKSELWFSWNPRHNTDPVDLFFRGPTQPPDCILVKANYSDNPWFPAESELERQFDEVNNPARYGHVWLGEYEPQAVGAIWTREVLHRNRRTEAPKLKRILVSIDPSISSTPGADECGIVVPSLGEDNRGYVLDDLTLKGSPQQWAERAIAGYDLYEADAMVAEVNQGGEMVANTIHSLRPSIRVIEVRATRGKHVRAEPISALYSLDRISHVGAFPKLEAEMCLMTAAGYEGDGSPNRCLVAGTLIETANGSIPIECVTPGDFALTRTGYKRVIAAQKTGRSMPVFRIELSDRRELIGTGDHPVFVNSYGFVRLDALVRDDILVTCEERQLLSIVEHIHVTRIRRIVQHVFTFIITPITDAVTVLARCIGIFGNTTTGPYQTGVSYITKTITRSTTIQTIWNVFPVRNMLNGIRRYTVRPWHAWIMPALSRIYGMAAKKVLRGIQSMAAELGIIANHSLVYASNAVPNTEHWDTGTRIDSVRACAYHGITNAQSDTTKSDNALYAISHSQPKSQNHKFHARISVVRLSDAGTADVFNLTVAEDNEYFANGILVHNCDALVWGFSELFPKMVRRERPKNKPPPSRANNQYRPHRMRA